MRKQLQLLCLTIVMILAGMIACRSKETPTAFLDDTELSFETVLRGDRSLYSGSEPVVILITDPQGIEQLDNLIDQSVLDEIAKLDFDRYFVIALFRDRQGSSGYDVIIDRVTRHGNKIVIHAQFWELNETGSAVTHRDTLPYHIIKVRKEIEVELKRQVMTPPPIPSR